MCECSLLILGGVGTGVLPSSCLGFHRSAGNFRDLGPDRKRPHAVRRKVLNTCLLSFKRSTSEVRWKAAYRPLLLTPQVQSCSRSIRESPDGKMEAGTCSNPVHVHTPEGRVVLPVPTQIIQCVCSLSRPRCEPDQTSTVNCEALPFLRMSTLARSVAMLLADHCSTLAILRVCSSVQAPAEISHSTPPSPPPLVVRVRKVADPCGPSGNVRFRKKKWFVSFPIPHSPTNKVTQALTKTTLDLKWQAVLGGLKHPLRW